MTRQFDLLVCDLDNTLYDWVGAFVPAFTAMVDEAVAIIGCDRGALLDDLRAVHRRHHDSEHPFALLETETVQAAFPHRSRAERHAALDPAFLAFNRARKANLALYRGVEAGLERLLREGIRLVAHTESKTLGAVGRLHKLGIADAFARLYCRESLASAHPDPTRAHDPAAEFGKTRIRELSKHQRKPDPTVLREICAAEGVPVERTAYVGDSIARDIAMAREVGVFAIWAEYGTHVSPALYDILVRVSHWTEEDVAREKALKAAAARIRPDVTAEDFHAVVAAVLAEAATLKSAIG